MTIKPEPESPLETYYAGAYWGRDGSPLRSAPGERSLSSTCWPRVTRCWRTGTRFLNHAAVDARLRSCRLTSPP